MNIPESFTKEEFQKLTNKTLGNKPQDNNPFQQYKKIITDNYKKDRGSGNYILKEGLSSEALANIDFIFKRIGYKEFNSIREIAEYFKRLLEEKKYIVLFAYNGTGKTRLSAEFKSLGQQLNEETGEKTADTLYYNAFTEDLFYWDNDLDNDNHPEVRGILGHIEGESLVISGGDDIDEDVRFERLGILSQTTQREASLAEVVSKLVLLAGEIKVYNTICRATIERQESIRNLATQVDGIVVIGGRNSANTRKLVEIAESLGVSTLWVEHSGEVDRGWLPGKRSIGVAAGGSTPDWLINDLTEKLKTL